MAKKLDVDRGVSIRSVIKSARRSPCRLISNPCEIFFSVSQGPPSPQGPLGPEGLTGVMGPPGVRLLHVTVTLHAVAENGIPLLIAILCIQLPGLPGLAGLYGESFELTEAALALN
jgi:hypothetical protein